MRKLLACATVVLALGLVLACGDDKDKKKGKKKADKTAKKAGKGKGKGKGTGKAPADPRAGAAAPAPVVDLPSGEEFGPAGVKGFTRWKPVSGFVSEKIVDVAALGRNEALALASDGHVGVTRDGGKSWHYQRLFHQKVQAVHGNIGGPYFAVGKKGFAARSGDGKVWKGLHLVTQDDLTDVVVTPTLAVAIGKKGSVVTYSGDGRKWALFQMPKGKRPKRVHIFGQKPFVQVGAKEVWATKDNGRAWVPLQTPLALPSGKQVRTTQGVCKLGNFAKSRGMVCTVKGTGFGLSAKEIFVVSKDTVNSTRDGGTSWRVAKLPFSGVNRIRGFAGGPYIAAGKRGTLAVSKDGASWTLKRVGTTAALNDILVKGDRVLVVGTAGAVLLSKDKGQSFQLVPVQPKRTFTHIVDKGATILLPAGPSLMVSKDLGQTWSAAEDKKAFGDIPPRPRVANCPGSLPTPGIACRLTREARSPEGLPRMRMFEFRGDFGISGGDQGLLAVTTNGGASWNTHFGYHIKKGIKDLQVKGKLAVAVGKSRLVYSRDTGKTWREAVLPKKTGSLNAAFIDDDGSVFVVGDRGTVLKSVGALAAWAKIEVDPKNKTSFVKMMKAGNALYAAGSKGQLYRSADKGRSWIPVRTGQSQGVIRMTARANTVLAVVPTVRRRGWSKYRSNNVLLKSDNGGMNFYLQAVLSFRGAVTEFYVDSSGRLVYEDMISGTWG